MSAIVGILHLDGRPVERSVLERMINSLAHRGADGVGVWSEGSVGLGHRMLQMTPESVHEELPLTNQAGELVITADARLDNRDELIHSLGLGGPREAISDSALVLEAYEKWGEDCPKKLLGDFVFAIWDRRRQTLFCARDHMGVKPLYYHRSGRVFVFASEIKALLCVPEVPRRLNETRVADYLIAMVEDEAITFHRGIHRLPPRCHMSVGREAKTPRIYWSLDPSRDVRFRSDAEYAEAFREIFTEAVRCRLRSAYPLGSLLSGGLDSSSIVCIARKLLAEEGDRRLSTFSCLFDDIPESDERGFINTILNQGGLEAYSARTDLTGPLTDLERLLWYHDEAFFVSNLFLNWSLYGIVRQQGIRALLDGVDGDTVVSHGEMYLAELARKGRWKTLVAEARAFSKHTKSPFREVLRDWVLDPLAPKPARWAWRALRRLRGRDGRPPWVEGTNIVRPDFARRIGLADRFHALQAERTRPARTEREEHLRYLDSGMNSLYFEEDDKTAAAFSVRHLYPFYDKRVMEFCLALPPEQKLKRGWDRVVLRRAMDGILPKEVQWRSDKADLSPTFDRGLLKYCRKLMEEVIFDDPEAIEEYVDMRGLRETYRRFVSRGEGEDSTIIWGAVTLAVWLRQTGLSP